MFILINKETFRTSHSTLASYCVLANKTCLHFCCIFSLTGVYLSWLVDSFLWICFDFVARMVGDFRDRLFKDRGCLSHWERCVQVWFSLCQTQNRINLRTTIPQRCFGQTHWPPESASLKWLENILCIKNRITE